MAVSVAKDINITSFVGCFPGYDELRVIPEIDYLTYYIAGILTNSYEWVVTVDDEQFLIFKHKEAYTLAYLIEKVDKESLKSFFSRAQLGMDDSLAICDIHEKFKVLTQEFLRGKTIIDSHSCLDFIRRSLGSEIIKEFMVN